MRAVESPGGSTDDTDRWSGLIGEHDRTVVLSLLARGAHLSEAREIAHETWALLFERWAAGDLTQLSLPGLAIAQARFLLATGRRHAARRAPLSELATLADPTATADERVLHRQLLERASTAFEACPPRARVVFLSAYEQPGAPHRLLATALGISLQRFRQTLCEVRARLRSALHEARDD